MSWCWGERRKPQHTSTNAPGIVLEENPCKERTQLLHTEDLAGKFSCNFPRKRGERGISLSPRKGPTSHKFREDELASWWQQALLPWLPKTTSWAGGDQTPTPRWGFAEVLWREEDEKGHRWVEPCPQTPAKSPDVLRPAPHIKRAPGRKAYGKLWAYPRRPQDLEGIHYCAGSTSRTPTTKLS